MIDATQILLNPNRCYKTVKNAKKHGFMAESRRPLHSKHPLSSGGAGSIAVHTPSSEGISGVYG
jgi:hypothetical protein